MSRINQRNIKERRKERNKEEKVNENWGCTNKLAQERGGEKKF
jgi:hypothetical protein